MPALALARFKTYRACALGPRGAWAAVLGAVVLNAALLPASRATTPLPGGADLQRLQDVLDRRPAISPIAPNMLPTVAEPASLTTKEAEDARFLLRSLTISGATVYPPESFLPLADHMTGQQSSVAELYRFAARITARYRADGYILARAILPAQDITSGHVTLEIIEGRLEDIQLTGPAGVATNARLNAISHKIPMETPLRAPELEAALLTLTDTPGLTATSTLVAGEAPGTSRLIINVAEETPSATVGLSNWGTRYLGPWQTEADLTLPNTVASLGNGHDMLQARLIQATDLSDLTYADATYTTAVGPWGTQLEGRAAYSTSAPGYVLEALEIESEATELALTLRQPLTRSRTFSANIYGTLAAKNADTLAMDSPLSTDKLRLLRAGVNLAGADRLGGINDVNVELTHGLDIWNATTLSDQAKSRLRGHGTGFTKAKIDVSRLQNLGPTWNLLLAGSGQFASHALLAGEEFGVGGETYGRGYDTSEIIGDHGVELKAELQANFNTMWDEMFTNFQVLLFTDFGAVWTQDRGPNVSGTAETLLSNGIGLRANVTDTLTAEVTLAKPRTRAVASQGIQEKNPTVFVRVQNRFEGPLGGSGLWQKASGLFGREGS